MTAENDIKPSKNNNIDSKKAALLKKSFFETFSFNFQSTLV